MEEQWDTLEVKLNAGRLAAFEAMCQGLNEEQVLDTRGSGVRVP